ncbi:MAG: hypothetical protein ACOH1J_00945 [Microbacteriaceae bacterium]
MTLYENEYPIQPRVELQFEPPPATPPLRPRKKRSPLRLIVGVATVAALVGIGAWVSFNQQLITDQFTVWSFEPSAAVESHVDRLQFTDRGRFLYFASTPIVSDSETFATECPKRAGEEDYGILGCYLPSTKMIFLFDVTDERLDGTEETTAAHEMLHAAWDRLSDQTQRDIAALLEVEYERLSDDAEFVKRMEFYARTEPGQRANELHSIIGTETAQLSPELEAYYSEYFTDRTIVTDLHVASNAAFVEIQARADALIANLNSLRDSIESDYAGYTSDSETLRNDVGEFNRRADTPGAFPNQSAFDRERAALLQRQASLDDLYASITARSSQYDALVVELDGVNSTAAELQRALNIGAETDSGL